LCAMLRAKVSSCLCAMLRVNVSSCLYAMLRVKVSSYLCVMLRVKVSSSLCAMLCVKVTSCLSSERRNVTNVNNPGSTGRKTACSVAVEGVVLCRGEHAAWIQWFYCRI
jgi:hypothetical protein